MYKTLLKHTEIDQIANELAYILTVGDYMKKYRRSAGYMHSFHKQLNERVEKIREILVYKKPLCPSCINRVNCMMYQEQLDDGEKGHEKCDDYTEESK